MTNRIPMKRQKSATFAKSSSNIYTLTIKFIVNLNIIFILLVNTEVLQIAHLI